jgi:hypothetical protein
MEKEVGVERVVLPALSLILMVCVPGAALSGEVVTREAGIDALERRLEMERHERLAALKAEPGSSLADFTTDGCSGGMSAGWEFLSGKLDTFRERHGDDPPWEECCFAHDRLYHRGGRREATAAESFDDRKSADLALRDCVLETGAERTAALEADYDLTPEEVRVLYEAVADLIHRAVRIGGMPCTGLPWRWGYGWPECR